MNLSPEDKIQFVRCQMNDAHAGKLDEIVCPYCDESMSEGNIICCTLMSKCVAAILDEADANELCAKADRILNNFTAQQYTQSRIIH